MALTPFELQLLQDKDLPKVLDLLLEEINSAVAGGSYVYTNTVFVSKNYAGAIASDGSLEHPYTTIQDAIDHFGRALNAGDFQRALTIIVLDSGNYTENLIFYHRSYNIIGNFVLTGNVTAYTNDDEEYGVPSATFRSTVSFIGYDANCKDNHPSSNSGIRINGNYQNIQDPTGPGLQTTHDTLFCNVRLNGTLISADGTVGGVSTGNNIIYAYKSRFLGNIQGRQIYVQRWEDVSLGDQFGVAITVHIGFLVNLSRIFFENVTTLTIQSGFVTEEGLQNCVFFSAINMNVVPAGQSVLVDEVTSYFWETNITQTGNTPSIDVMTLTQIDLNVKILRHGGIIGVNCDYNETSLATVFNNLDLTVIGDFTGLTIRLNNVYIHQDKTAIIDIVQLSNTATVKGDLHCNTINIPVGSATLIHSDFTGVATVNGSLTLKHCTTTSSFTAPTHNITVFNSDLVDIVDVALLILCHVTMSDIGNLTNQCIIHHSTLNNIVASNNTVNLIGTEVIGSIGNLGGSLIMTNGSTVAGNVGNIALGVRLDNSDIFGSVGTITQGIELYHSHIEGNINAINLAIGFSTMIHSSLSGIISTVVGQLRMFNSEVNEITTISLLYMEDSNVALVDTVTNAVSMYNNSVINRLNHYNSNIQLDIIESTIRNLVAISVALVTINSRRSRIGLNMVGISVKLTDGSDIEFEMLNPPAQTLQFGDGSGAGGFSNCYIKVLAQVLNGGVTFVDGAFGGGTDTFSNLVVDMYFANAITENLNGGATNIINNYGNTTAGVAGASNWTTNVLGY